MKKHYSCLLGSIVICCLLVSQSYGQALFPVSLDKKVQASSLIVEGSVVSKTSFWNPAHTMIFTSNKVKLHKIFKGDVAGEFIEVLTQGGSVDNFSIEASELLELSVGDIGMFFCYPNQIGLINPVSQASLMDVYSSTQGFLKYDMQKKTADAAFASYPSIVTKLYPGVTQKTGHSYENVDLQFSVGETPIPQNNLLGISSFSPTTVVAGATENAAQNLLTINGTDFGPAAGSAAIVFDDANDGSGGAGFVVAYSSPLVVSWTNTQIQVRVPTRAGTGFFSVRDQSGASTGSPGLLTVSYSVLTASFSAGALIKQSNLMNNNASGGYTILYSTNTAGSGINFDASAVKETFQRALNTWKEVSGLNVIEGGTTNIQFIGTAGFGATDGSNVIMFDNSNTGVPPLADGVLAVCYSYNGLCSPGATNNARKTEFDIVVRNTGYSLGSTAFENGPCYPSAAGTTIDMETVLLHELGHALNLGHINDSYQFVGPGNFSNFNPGKIMNYAIVNGVARRSLDLAAYAGSLYTINPKGLAYGTCVPNPANTEMIPLATITEPKDDCPLTFPATTTPNNTLINFDLAHATSNKFVDPQYTNVDCSGNGTPVTNNAYYAIRTGFGGTLELAVGSYTVTPASALACGTDAVKLTLYQTSSCPTGQAFPAPVTCRTFTSNGPLAAITGLAANTNYLIYVDGSFNTKATFSLLINGAALPVRVTNFDGQVKTDRNEVNWTVDVASTVRSLILEGSEDGRTFTTLSQNIFSSSVERIENHFNDFDTRAVKYYRLKLMNADGSMEYSEVLVLRRNLKINTAIISPNPVDDHVNIILNRASSGKVEIQLINAEGKLLRSQVKNTGSGNQTIMIDKLGNLAAGTYIIRIIDGTTTSNYKMLKL